MVDGNMLISIQVHHRYMYLLWLMWCVVLTVSAGSVALLCRNCGREIVKGSALTNEKSVKAIRSYNMTILGRNQLVQVFENGVPEKFDVITASSAELRLAGKSHLADTWWPNYEWTVCVCPSCGFHLGWYFQSGNIQSKVHKSFVGLVLDYLISEEYVDLLTWVP